MQPPPGPSWGQEPPPPKKDTTVIVIVVVAIAAVLAFVVVLLVAAGAGFYMTSRKSSGRTRPTPTASPTTTPTATTASCGECSWQGTGCYNGACRLLPGQVWGIRPKQVTMRDLPETMNGAAAKMCLRVPGNSNVCTDFRMPKAAGGKHVIAFGRSTALGAEINVATELLSSGGFDAILIVGGQTYTSTGLHHPSGVRPGRLLFEGGLRFGGQGQMESVVIDLEAK